MDITRLSVDVGVRKMSKERYEELRNLNLLDIPEIKKCLIEREKMLGHAEDKIENNINVIAKAITTRVFTDSRTPKAKWLGTELRRIAVYELCLLGYTQTELAVIFDVSRYTIREDIKSFDNIRIRDWWGMPPKTEEHNVMLTKVWEFTSLPNIEDYTNGGLGVNGERN